MKHVDSTTSKTSSSRPPTLGGSAASGLADRSRNMMELLARSAGKRVLLVDSIRDDVPSGGRTATSTITRQLQGVADVRVLRLAPRGGARPFVSLLLFSLISFPAPVFVVLHRLTGWIWLEFFSRASPWFFLRCLWMRMKMKPDVVVLNHHASFLYGCAFPGAQVVMVWHDVPSLKRDDARSTRRGARRCAAIERWLLRFSDASVALSFDDVRVLRRLHSEPTKLTPVVDAGPSPQSITRNRSGVLLIGNWWRPENCDGAALLFDEYLAICDQLPLSEEMTFHVAGAGADRFVNRWRESRQTRRLKIAVTPRYDSLSDFSEVALLAPLTRGAGIKLKTIEAWAVGLPVLGTRQAFTGVPPHIWRTGGLRVDTVADLARLCANPVELAAACAALAPLRAFEMYQSALSPSVQPTSACPTLRETLRP